MSYSLHEIAEIEERNGELEAENADLRAEINELKAQLNAKAEWSDRHRQIEGRSDGVWARWVEQSFTEWELLHGAGA